MKTSELKKKIAGEKAVDSIENGMTIGLGSGSTVYWMLRKLKEKVDSGLNIKGIPTSKRTEGWAKEFGIPLTDFSETTKIDLAIDGANEIDTNLNLLKGGGGSLVREKIVNHLANRLIIIADDGKLCNQLGKHHLPVEVVPFGWKATARSLEQLGCSTTMRLQDEQVFISDNGNYIIDCHFGLIENPNKLHEQLKLLVGVIETGLFCNMTDLAIIGHEEKVELLR
ncbi:ribose 5-phosphate isomerase A [Oceanobacillus kapialis]|uniref:Ribose-5-phosphate isomerase A n=1 Tax=Oceanobacillus kapialis TaxID=481353 RepID=A0ABW5PWB7_9BACI